VRLGWVQSEWIWGKLSEYSVSGAGCACYGGQSVVYRVEYSRKLLLHVQQAIFAYEFTGVSTSVGVVYVKVM
jgi:hypothetical protein